MRPFRKNLAISIDGGGLRGLIAICALEEIEKALGQPLYKTARLLSGSSTGSIIAGAIASGLTAAEIHQLYAKLGDTVFRKSWRTLPVIGALSGYQYDRAPLAQALHDSLGD